MYGKDAVQSRSQVRNTGLTLLESMVCLALAAVLLGIAAPSFQKLLLDSRRASAVNQFLSALNYARSQAVTARTAVTICRSFDASTCAGDGDWRAGWIVFVDTDADGALDADENILRQQRAVSAGPMINGNRNVRRRITFRSTGTTSNNGRLAVCDSRGWTDDARIIVVSVAGRVRALTRSGDPNEPLPGCMP
ncbi:MAG: Tfp pilus assembly protein FimT/FimU [Nevskia sp.]